MKKGFTLIEVVIVIAVMAILAAVLIPVVTNNIRSARLARAAADARSIGEAMVRFRQDLGFWPVRNETAVPPTLEELYGPGNQDPTAWNGWDGKARAELAYHLLRNDGNYRNDAASRAQGLPCWNGPYLNTVATDPWGRPFLANVASLEGARSPNAAFRVFVLSPGPNSAIETAFAAASDPAGDDVAFRLQ